MSFFTKVDSNLAAKQNLFPDFTLSQRGRAGIDILGALQQFSSSHIRAAARAEFEADRDAEALSPDKPWGNSNESWDERIGRAREIAERSQAYRMERFYHRYVAEEVWERGIEAVEERRAQFEAFVKLQSEGVGGAGGTLTLDPELPVPDYHAGVDYHLEPGGWDGYDLYGPLFAYVLGPRVYKRGGYAAVEVGDDIVAQREAIARQLPKKSYGRIYEPACGGMTLLAAAGRAFPMAELAGCDLSALMLTNGHRIAERLGVKIDFKQEDARHTSEPDESADAILMHSVAHELPTAENLAIFKECFRILKPGGDIVISDPPPFAAVTPFQSVLLDWETDNREEPYFSEACSNRWDEHLATLGFVNCEGYALGPKGYPWITRAQKPL
jgi:SAM-dependent methyltransferase